MVMKMIQNRILIAIDPFLQQMRQNGQVILDKLGGELGIQLEPFRFLGAELSICLILDPLIIAHLSSSLPK